MRSDPSSRMLLALLLFGAATCAQAKEHEGWVYNGLSGWGSASLDELDDSSFSSNPTIGYRWGRFGVEAGYGWFGDFEEDFDDGTRHIDTEATLRGWNFGANYNHDLGDRWSLQARAGLFTWDVDGTIDDNLLTAVRFQDDGADWYAGGSITFRSTKRSSIGLGYTHFAAGDAHVDLWGLATELRF